MTLTIIVVTLILAYKVYESEYFIRANEDSIEKAIEEYIDLDISSLYYKEFQNVLIVYYEAANGELDGSTVLYRGFNNRYQIRETYYSTNKRVFSGVAFKSYGKRYLAVMGVNHNMQIDKVVIETNSDVIEEFMTDEESYIIKILKSDTDWDDSLKDYKLYDNKGNDITQQLNNIKGYDNKGITKAETFMLYVYCVIILAVGYFISRGFREDKRNKKDT